MDDKEIESDDEIFVTFVNEEIGEEFCGRKKLSIFLHETRMFLIVHRCAC